VSVSDQDDPDNDASGDPKATRKRKLRPLTGLSIEELRHPSDARATDALKKIARRSPATGV